MQLKTIRCAANLKACAVSALLTFGCPAMTHAESLVRCAPFTESQLAAAEPRRNPHARARFELINRLAQAHSYRVLFLGDSLTERWDEVGEDRRIWEKNFRRFDPLNAGINGDRTEHLLWRIEHGNLENQGPSVVVLLIGTNDLGHGRPPEEAAEGVRRILIRLRERLPEARVLLQALWPRTDLSRLGAAVASVNKRLQRCDDGAKVRYVDPGHKLLDNQGSLVRDIAPDGLHPSPRGYGIVSPLIATALAAELTDR